jgi:tRNA (cmo5U34)-methyltransferase
MNNINPFKFEEQKEFDQHINLSIPNYNSLDCIFSHITKEFSQPDTVTVDLGCSTGRFLHSLPKVVDCKYIGIDKIDMKTFDGFTHIVGDCESELNKLTDVGVIISMFCLQFLGAKKRKKTLNAIKKHIDNGAVLLVAEKVYLNDTRLQTLLHRMHIQAKRENFTNKEILDKDNQLSISMFCKTEDELMNELTALGRVTPVWQSYNFLGYVVQQ